MLEATTKKTPHVQRQRRSCSKQQEGAITIKSGPMPTGGQPTNWRAVILKWFSHCSESSETHVRLPSLGAWQRNQESPGNVTLKAAGFDPMTFTGLRETVLEGTKYCVHQDPRERGRDPTGDWLGPACWCWSISRGGGVRSGSLHRDRGMGSSSPGMWPLIWALLEVAINPTIAPVDSRTGSPQTTNREGAQPHPSADNQIKV